MITELPHRRLQVFLRPFFREHLPLHRGVSPNTIHSYRDAWRLLLRYGTQHRDMGPADNWRVSQVDRAFILDFLVFLEEHRKVCTRTRNYRLAAIHAFFNYLRGMEPGLDHHCRRILAIPFKRARHAVVGFLEPDELCATLRAVPPDQATSLRDLALLIFAYNTGARVHEIAQARRDHIFAGSTPYIRILGKGNKERDVPLWQVTLDALDAYRRHGRPRVRDAVQACYLFLGASGHSLTRYHVGRLITKYIRLAVAAHPAMRKKRLHAHSMRHTTAVHLLQSRAELNTIKAWLGHASIESLQVYLDLDLTKKREVLDRLITPSFLEACRPNNLPSDSVSDSDLLDWLDKL